jgi:hypothetical protein
MNSRLIGICLFSLACAGFAHPEQSVPPPNAPYVATPSPGSSWEIAVECKKPHSDDASSEASPNRRPAAIRAAKNGNVSRVTAIWNDGTTTVGYVQGDNYVFKSPQTGRVIVLAAQENNLFEPIFVSGYQATGWIKKNDYKGIEKVGPDECYKYHRDYWARVIDGDRIISPEMNAWIRVQDGVPLCIQVGELLFRYRYAKDLPPLVEIPTEIKQKLDQIQAEQNAVKMVLKRNLNSQR